jgi:hypothetical protein
MAKAANFGLPGGLGKDTFIKYAAGNYGVEISANDFKGLKKTWLTMLPEMDGHLTPTKVFSGGEGEDDKYMASTTTGRVRMNTTFCAACNTPFQGLAADVAKDALWELYKHGFKMVNFVHDEVIFEMKNDSLLSDKVERAEKIMLGSMEKYCPDVKCGTESAAMERWYKEAEPVYDNNGRLQGWMPAC